MTTKKNSTPKPEFANIIYRLGQLAERMENPGPEYLKSMMVGLTEANLVQLGQAYASERIIATVPAFVGAIEEQELSPEQRVLLVGYSPRKLAALVHETVRLRELSVAYDERATLRVRPARAKLQASMTSGFELRDIVERTLEEIVALRSPLRSQLEQATGPAPTAAALSRSLRALASVSEAVRAAASKHALANIEEVGITSALISELRERADQVDADDEAASGIVGTRNAQRELDYQDGVVLTLISTIYRAFEYANSRSPKIVVPPLGRLKRLVQRYKSAPATEPPVPVPVPSDPSGQAA